MDMQTVVVLGAVLSAGVWLGRYLVRSFLRRGPVGCGDCQAKRVEKLPIHPEGD
jgi:hypothetical protein